MPYGTKLTIKLNAKGTSSSVHSHSHGLNFNMIFTFFVFFFFFSSFLVADLQKLINYLRVHSHAHCYGSSMSPPVAQQIISSMRIIMGLDGTDEGKRRTNQLARNTVYFRRRLAQMGVITIGHENSPVVPMMVYLFSKIA